MTKTVRIAMSALLATALLGSGALLPATASAAAAKPGCALKSGAKSAVGTVVGDWKCEGTHWHKVAATHLPPFKGLYGL